MNPRAIPGATYRLQFNAKFTFADARRIVPYLHDLGITHCYASPIFEAAPGSTHGYDVCRFDRLNPILGSADDFEQFVSALHENGMGLILDMVPNHMAADVANPWWRDVLKNGPNSPFANYFDIKWKPLNRDLHGKVLLPVLEDDLPVVLQQGKIQLLREAGEFLVAYHEKRFPIAPKSEATARSGDLAALLEQQHYRLANWRDASTEINYRRFFDVAELVSLNMERPEVFEATHSLIFRLIAEGKVDGLRIDHPDGLWDPKAYFDGLRCDGGSLYMVVEKILGPGENLPTDWPVEGTTGYDFLNVLNGLFVDSRNEDQFTQIYRRFTGKEKAFAVTAYKSRKRILEKSFGAELNALAHRLANISGKMTDARALTIAECRRALRETIACFPVYRTYAREHGSEASKSDRRQVDAAIQDARAQAPEIHLVVFLLIRRLLVLKGPKGIDETLRHQCARFAMRFQQLTGPVAAKGLEDTAFYRYNRLISLNEVGGDPKKFGISVKEFHAFNEYHAKHWPRSMLATSTHDTKRGEDVRAAINVLSEIPAQWEAAVTRWRELNASKKQIVREKPAPDANDEYFFYQTMIGAWPATKHEPISPSSEFHRRIVEYMLKAIKEAKSHTSWTDPSPDYERAMTEFVERVLDPANQPFLDEFTNFQSRVAFFGRLNSLSQLLLKVTSPGVPDFYQGTEFWDLNLVDPDNRRPVDYGVRQSLLDEIVAHEKNRLPDEWLRNLASNLHSPMLKTFVIRRALQYRNAHRDLFEKGEYLPLEVIGAKKEHVVAFARVLGSKAAIIVVPRLCWSLTNGARRWPLAGNEWGETGLSFPASQFHSELSNILTGEKVAASNGNTLLISELLASLPVVLILSRA